MTRLAACGLDSLVSLSKVLRSVGENSDVKSSLVSALPKQQVFLFVARCFGRSYGMRKDRTPYRRPEKIKRLVFCKLFIHGVWLVKRKGRAL